VKCAAPAPTIPVLYRKAKILEQTVINIRCKANQIVENYKLYHSKQLIKIFLCLTSDSEPEPLEPDHVTAQTFKKRRDSLRIQPRNID
jgi:hypothetical protein